MKLKYEKIYIIDSKEIWDSLKIDFNLENDLVLTYDFGLYKYVKDLGAEVFYIDKMLSSQQLEENNHIIYEFFKNWHYNKNDEDIFKYKDISFGFAFRLEFWNDYVSYIRLFLSLSLLKNVHYNSLVVSTETAFILNILNSLSLKYELIKPISFDMNNIFYFPISKWLDSKIRPTGILAVLLKTRETLSNIYSKVMFIYDKYFNKKIKYKIFIHKYHPTKKLIEFFREEKDIRLVLANFSRYGKKLDFLKERVIPISGTINSYEKEADLLMNSFRKDKTKILKLTNGEDISQQIYKVIEDRIESRLANILRTLDNCIKYLDNNDIDLLVLIANIGHTETLLDMVAKHRNIPSFLIINGLLLSKHQDESKYATYINSYGESLKYNYFKDMNNIVTLGDSRMDSYSNVKKNKINRFHPTITIGASGFNSIDLNSYVAIEFDFIYEILLTLKKVALSGDDFDIIIKVRPNGYKQQYINFVKKYFPSLKIRIESTKAMYDVLRETDFYISICSQTLFEASCLGIPVVYYKNDSEELFPPFDGNSEVVIAKNTLEMERAYTDFKNESTRYNEFLDQRVLEKYIGELDGKSFERNKEFIYKILNKGGTNI